MGICFFGINVLKPVLISVFYEIKKIFGLVKIFFGRDDKISRPGGTALRPPA